MRTDTLQMGADVAVQGIERLGRYPVEANYKLVDRNMTPW